MPKQVWISNNYKAAKFCSGAERLTGHFRFVAFAAIFFSLMNANTPAFAQPWKTYIASPFVVYWDSVASSADGTKLIAVGNMSPSGASAVFTSTNSGLTWDTNNAPFAIWSAVAASADGNDLVMVAATGPILTSTNAGATWIQSTNAPMLDWSAVASSSNGMKLVATAINNQPFVFTNGEQYPPGPSAIRPNGLIYTSTNAGMTWRSNAVYSGYYVPPIGPGWTCVASSADGDKLFATAGFEGIYCSTNGSIWIPLDTPLNYVVSVAASGDGNRLFMTGFDNDGNDIWAVSADGGQTWTTNVAPYGGWSLVASSADGTNLLVADTVPAPIYTSNDAGVTWSTNDIPAESGYGGSPILPFWRAVASSADGSKLIAIGDWQKIYTWQFQPTLRLATSRTNNVVSWRNLSLSSGFVLQQNCNLFSNNWTDVVSPVTDDGTNFSITLSKWTNALFFRLKK